MKLVRYGAPGAEKPGLIDAGGTLRDLSALVGDIDGAAVTPAGLARLRGVEPDSLPAVDDAAIRLGPPLAGVGKLVCIGLNYSDHAREAGLPIPDEPVVFMKATSAISGPSDPVIRPRDASRLDWEVELAFVVGTRARRVAPADAPAHIAGYLVLNDVSERGFQFDRGGQWVKGKSFDSFCPLGPWLVTADEVPDPQALSIWLEVNGHRYQDGNTRTMIFPVAELLAHVSQFMTLEPGDIVSTGTPPGVGLGVKPEPVFLEVGDEMRLGIDGLGEQRLRVVAEDG